MSRYALWIAIGWTIAVSIFLVFFPIYSGTSTTVGPDGSTIQSMDPRRSLLEVNGSRALVALTIPLLLATAPLLARSAEVRRPIAIISAVLLFGLVILGAFSIGLFYLPSAIAMAVSAFTTRPAASQPAST